MGVCVWVLDDLSSFSFRVGWVSDVVSLALPLADLSEGDQAVVSTVLYCWNPHFARSCYSFLAHSPSVPSLRAWVCMCRCLRVAGDWQCVLLLQAVGGSVGRAVFWRSLE